MIQRRTGSKKIIQAIFSQSIVLLHYDLVNCTFKTGSYSEDPACPGMLSY